MPKGNACRAGTITTFSCGSDESWLGKYARFDQSYADPPPTVACGAMRPNPWGLFDMHGNAWEWCNSWYDADLLRSADPAFVGSARVVRGGAWVNAAAWLRSAYRSFYHPAYADVRVGFRVARALLKP